MEKKFPSKRLGQNYLRDDNIVRKIIAEISPASDDTIIEIGPGEGVLTSHMIDTTKNLIAVEIDKRNIQLLEQNFPNLNLIEGDFLKVDLKQIQKPCNKKLRIAGNIPYNITSPIIFKMIENREIISDSVLMIQYEVAQRIIAKPGGRDYGILSVITQYFADVKLCFKVSPNVFYPRPKVFSAVIHFRFKDERPNKSGDEIFIQVVKAAFGNRRKMLSNSLKNSIFAHINFNETGIDLSQRAEQLSIDDYVRLARFTTAQGD
jgi:16S rRNA (adenine1518-N6/adenine1519-N6)-dimethyltransferase